MSYENMPKLRNLEISLENELAEIENTRNEIENNPRYDDMPSEKEYQLQQLTEQREATLQDHEERFQTEVASLEAKVADETFNMPAVPESTMASVNGFVNNVKQQLKVSLNAQDTLHLLSVKAGGLNDVEKQALHMSLGELKDIVSTKQLDGNGRATANKLLNEIEATAADTKRGRKLNDMQSQLREIKDSGATLRRAYDAKQSAIERYRKQLHEEHNVGNAADPDVYRYMKQQREEGGK